MVVDQLPEAVLGYIVNIRNALFVQITLHGIVIRSQHGIGSRVSVENPRKAGVIDRFRKQGKIGIFFQIVYDGIGAFNNRAIVIALASENENEKCNRGTYFDAP